MLGGKVACVSCWDRNDKKSYTYSHKDGVDPHFLLTIVDEYGTIDKKKAKKAGYVVEDGEAWITKEADVLIPAAIEGHVNGETIKKMSQARQDRCRRRQRPRAPPKPTSSSRQNNIFDIPDFLCNAGGVTSSYFESRPERYELLLDQGRSPGAAR